MDPWTPSALVQSQGKLTLKPYGRVNFTFVINVDPLVMFLLLLSRFGMEEGY